MGTGLDEALARLPGMTRAALSDEYQRLYKRDPPLNLSHRLLRLAVAYRLQEAVLGGLSASLKRQLGDGFLEKAPASAPGSVLIREWHGVHHTVRVDDRGVEYLGERFRSLSAVARLITGQRRSGIAFFGLRGNMNVD